jgi:uncharacterized membrane protein
MPASVDRTVTIDASPEAVLAVITDFEQYPSWQKDVDSAVITGRDDQGRPTRVTITTAAMGMKVEAPVEVKYGENQMEYHLIEPGSIAVQQDAFYVLTPVGTGTELNLKMEVDLKWNVPVFMMNQLITKGVNDNLKAVKRVAEAS